MNEEKKGYVFALHLTLGQAKAMGTKLIVGVHTDAEIAKHKVGTLSPLFITPHRHRREGYQMFNARLVLFMC